MSGLFGKDSLFRIIAPALKAPKGALLEAVVNNESGSTLRFSGSTFHQGSHESGASVHIRALLGRRIGVASTSGLDKNSLRSCVVSALDIARHAKEEGFDLRLPSSASYASFCSYSPKTASMPDGKKALMVKEGFEVARKKGATLSGALATKAGELFIMNSGGLVACHPYTYAHLSVIASKGSATGFESALTNDIFDIDAKKTASKAVRTCIASQGTFAKGPGRYRVLLEPPAVAELIHWLSYIGLGAKSYHEGSSFLSSRVGKRVTGNDVTIYDDALSSAGLGLPFDMEGTPKRKVVLIDKGIACAPVYDNFYGACFGTPSTGHAGAPGDSEGPMPEHLFMEPGKCSSKELLAGLDNGLVVKSFHYVNGLLNTNETLMTGMTRHGAFYLDKGELRPIAPLRFTEKVLDAFKRIEGVSRSTALFPNHSFPLSSIRVPALLIDGFNFTS